MHARHQLACAVLFSSLVSTTSPAHAKADKSDHVATSEDVEQPIAWTLRDNTHHQRPHDLALTISLWPDSFGAAVWYAVPVAPDGIIRDINDSFDLEFGASFAAYRSDYYWAQGVTSTTVYGLIPAFGVRYNLHLTRDWTTFATLKLGVLFGFSPGFYGGDWVDAQFTLGALYRLQESMQLRLELGYPFGFSVGLSFPVGGG